MKINEIKNVILRSNFLFIILNTCNVNESDQKYGLFLFYMKA